MNNISFYKNYRLLIFAILLFIFSFVNQQAVSSGNGFCTEFESPQSSMARLGGVRELQSNASDAEIESLARFAVDEHNNKENAALEFARVVEAREQLVTGTLHHFTIEATEEGNNKLYEAKVWVKPWLNFRELQEFKHTNDLPSTTGDE